MGEDAEVIIKISGDAKDFNSKMAKLVKDYENKEIDMKITANDLEQANQKLKEMNNVHDGIENKLKGINNQIQDYENQIAALTEKNATLNRSIWEEKRLYYANEDKIKSINAKIEAQKRLANEVTQEHNKQMDIILQQYDVIDKIEGKYEKQKNDLGVIATKIKEAGSVDLGSKMESVGKSINNTVKKVGKWALAIFGIRSAYMGIRRIMSGVLSQNEGLAKQMDGIKNSLYSALTPIVTKIINLIKTLMGYANAIWQKLFGKDLFKATSNSAKSTANSAKEINKQLAGFDEANVLSSNKSGGAGGSDSSGAFNIPLKKLPDWLDKFIDWCKDNPKLAGILFGTVAFTLFGGWKLASGLLSGIGGLISNFGLLAALAGTAYLIYLDYTQVKEAIKYYQDLIKYQNQVKGEVIDLSTENMKLANSFVENNKGIKANSEDLKWYRVWIKDTIQYNTELMKSEELDADAKHQLMLENQHLIKSYEALYKQGSLTEEEERNYYNFLNEVFPLGIEKTNKNLQDVRDTFDELDKKYNTEYSVNVSSSGEDKVKKSIDKVKDAFDKLGKSITDAFKLGQKVGTNVTDMAKSIFHANGGIVNMPGRGVPLHVAGEAGREGIIPIDNESQMALLGSEIAKRVTINLTNITEMNGRTISRELNRINNDSSFMTNS